uniref:DUF5672 domain-containing protein n=1 Tax=viral metagenome TaxID=1070528 RepID=A0A6C0FF70_9ZZZZ|tara:strand:- start:7558 stop:8352 length:795 start_codon:yes stop_codon:yes gene_type:complete
MKFRLKTLLLLVIYLILVSYLIKSTARETFGQEEEQLDAAVIVEPRKHEYLIPIVKDNLKKLPSATKFYVFHGTDNEDFVRSGFGPEIESGKMILKNLGVKNLKILDYNNLLTSKDFWNSIDGENILIYQTDTVICGDPGDKLKPFLKYDYVGAPWVNGKHSNGKGGNGGLSFRKKSAMLKALRDKKYNGLADIAEDIYFSNSDLNFPSQEEAKKFSAETMYSKSPFGVHKPWGQYKNEIPYLSKKEMSELRETCPELSTILEK